MAGPNVCALSHGHAGIGTDWQDPRTGMVVVDSSGCRCWWEIARKIGTYRHANQGEATGVGG